jgi:serine/threonine protein kinase
MTHPNWTRAKQVFQEALEKTGTERTHFVAAACGDDAELLAQVEALLVAHDEAGEFLASPTGAGADAAARAVAEEASDHPPEGPGTQIGPYKILQLIGEGGFGTVYMADQVEPIRRRVALKIIKLGMDTKEVIARFESERQALAMMDHPNIARVLDAGTTESGRPYFVMELVKGVPITEYCDANRLSTRERLDLFVDLCKAVHHAHEKGVVHRDIKPSNVMVTLHDGTPVPKVIDFGIAKATNQPLTEKTLFTAYGQFLGTPTYMSPEQAALGGLEIDRRCDVYSLGVLLYELLTGTTPFEHAALRSHAFMEVMRIIREEDPPTPSARLNTLGERLTEIATSRHVEPNALAKLVRGDLDWIVMHAIEKDRRRRYASASELAGDVARYFRNDPVTARRPSAAYRLSRFTKRRRGRVLAFAGMAGAIVLGAALAQALSQRYADPGPPINRLVLDGARDSNEGLPTRDGHHRLRYNQARRGYELVEIESGKSRRLISAGSQFRGLTSGFNDLSPDGRTLAIVRGPGATWGAPTAKSGRTELRLFTVGGQEEGRLVSYWGDDVRRAEVFGWTPGQTHVWVWLMRADRTASIASIDLKDGSQEVLKTLPWRDHTQPPSLSPDGRFITYHDAGPGQPPDIFIASTDGSQDLRVEHPARDGLPVFTPDGSGIVFLSNRKGGDLWFLPVADGRPDGDARAIWDDIGPYGQTLGFAENGSLFYYFAGSGWELYSVDVDLARGIVGQPELVPPQRGEINNAPAYSPDGRYLAHLRGSGRRLVLRELSTGNEREFPLGGSRIAPTVDFCPDGRSLIVAGYQGTRGQVVVHVNTEHGRTEQVSVVAEATTPALCVGNDNDLLYVGARKPSEPSRILRRSLLTGAESLVYRGPPARLEFARSPDGSRIAILTRPRTGLVEWNGDVQLVTVTVAGGPALTVPGVWTGVHGFTWMPDGMSVLVARQSPADSSDVTSPEITFWRVPLDGKAATEIGRMRLPPHTNSFYGSWNYRVHPSGSRIVFERHAGLVSQVWAIDNLLSFIQSGAPITVNELRRF